MQHNAGNPPRYNLSRMEAVAGYIPSLDGLRAVSILLVLLAHIISTKIFPGGLGVSIFFVISGFLITRLLFLEKKRTDRVNLSSFYVRRFLRLYPVAIVFTFCVLAAYVFFRLDINWLEPASALFYFSNYYYNHLEMAGTHGSMPFAIFWSLSIEEHFYIIFPSVFVLLRGNATRIALTMSILIAATLMLRLIMATMHPEWLETRIFYFQTQYRLDAIAWGVSIAALCESERGRHFLRHFANPAALSFAVLVVIFCLLYRNLFFRETIRYSLIGCAVACSIVSVIFSDNLKPLQGILNSTPVVWIGRLSYSLYIWHFIVPSVHAHLFGETPRLLTILSEITLSLMFAAISYYYVERPIMSLRHRFGSRVPETNPITTPASLPKGHTTAI